jgi:hypothetical protein
MKTTSLIVAVFAGLAIAAPSPQANGAAASRADVEIEFYTEREYRGGDPVIVKDFDEGECSTSRPVCNLSKSLTRRPENVPRKANNAVRSIRFRGSERYQCTFYTYVPRLLPPSPSR